MTEKVEAEVVTVRDKEVKFRKESEKGFLSLKWFVPTFTVVFNSNPGFDKGDKVKILAEKIK